MKLKAVRNFLMEDRVRGVTVNRKIGEVFDVDISDSENAETVFLLLQAKRVVLVDTNYIPASAKYIALFAFGYKSADGFPRSAKPNQEVELDGATAAEFLVSGHVKPVDEKQWTPRKLFGVNIEENEVKRMYDDPAPPKSWIQKGMRR